MGKDLNGNELGNGFLQEKSGLYLYRVRTQRETIVLRAKTLPELEEKIKKRRLEEEKKLQKASKKNSGRRKHIENKNDPCVYFISDGEYVKIGATDNLNKRLPVLQTGNPKKLKVIHKIHTENPLELEAILHEIFKERQITREWYDIIEIFSKADKCFNDKSLSVSKNKINYP